MRHNSGVVWTILVPFKPPSVAKSRLRGVSSFHEELVLAIARSTLEAAAASPAVGRIIVVGFPLAGFESLPDPFQQLNPALANAAASIDGPVAAMPADLPALRADELTEALALAGTRCFVPDFEGTGTVLLAAPEGELNPLFGPDSAAGHERSGARRLTGAWPTLRRDVDTGVDLKEAIRLGWRYLEPMQGTVSAFDPDTRSGELLLDDGTPIKFGTEAFDLSGLRLLRLGQRLRVEQGLDGSVEKISLVTL
ncbi:MAG TPA: 2-phospho-L-lactate guanylyltransferase [Candidatus Limnocylindrales bacterium]